MHNHLDLFRLQDLPGFSHPEEMLVVVHRPLEQGSRSRAPGRAGGLLAPNLHLVYLSETRRVKNGRLHFCLIV